jgi:ankyrin repeat protein
MYAALNRHEQLACWLLLSAEANPSLHDYTGETLADVAQAMNFQELRRVLNKLKRGSREHTGDFFEDDD